MTHLIPLWVGILWFASGTLFGAGLVMVHSGKYKYTITIQRKEK